jgi:hypothetical protein
MAPIRIDSTGHYLGRVPQYMFGPEKPDFQRPMTFEVNAINNGTMTIAVDRISDHATLRATLDGKPVGDFAFSAQPGSPGLVETAYKPDWKVYQANVEDRFVVDLSQGKHVIVVDVISGDWARIDSITFSGGQFSYQGVRRQTVALSDPASGDTLAWIRNSSSTWRADVDDKQPEPIKNLPLVLAASQPGSYSVEWWDTRTGTLVRTVKVAARGGLLTLTAPDFDRDIAVKAVHN